MSPATFTLRLPTDGAFPGLVGAVAARLLDLSGVATDEAARVEDQLARAAAELCEHADNLDCTFITGPDAIEVTLSAGTEHRTIRHPRP